MVKLSLEKTGEFEVEIENSGSNAVVTAKQFKPDLILLDIIMPDICGGKVAKKIRNEDILKDIPIIFLTATINEGDTVVNEDSAGRNSFLAKPVAPGKLIAFIKENLDK